MDILNYFITDGNRRKTNLQQSEITRGPDTIDPVWLESLVNGAKAYFSSSEEAAENEKQEIKDSEKTDENKAIYNQYFPNGENNKYGYVQPGNPVIPLANSNEDYSLGKIKNKTEKVFIPSCQIRAAV